MLGKRRNAISHTAQPFDSPPHFLKLGSRIKFASLGAVKNAYQTRDIVAMRTAAWATMKKFPFNNADLIAIFGSVGVFSSLNKSIAWRDV